MKRKSKMTLTAKGAVRRPLSFAMALCMALTLLTGFELGTVTAHAANYSGSYGSTTLSADNHTITGNTTFTGSAGKSGLIITGNTTITINAGVTLTVNGGAASGTSGAGAGIELTGGHTLTIQGAGTLVVNGGAAASGSTGGNGENGAGTGGRGGSGGDGGGGAGAGIGGKGGSAATGGAIGGYWIDNIYYGRNGAHATGTPGSMSGGTIRILGSVKATVKGGAAGSAGSGGSGGSQSSFGGSAGGGGGGGGGAGASIGGGGGGGGAGGGGGSPHNDYGGSGGGGGGGANGGYGGSPGNGSTRNGNPGNTGGNRSGGSGGTAVTTDKAIYGGNGGNAAAGGTATGVTVYKQDTATLNTPTSGSGCNGSGVTAVTTQCLVSYSVNGGSGTPPNASYITKGSNINVASGSALSRTGYAFAGWTTDAAGNNTLYKQGNAYTANATVTLYAKWTANTYNLTLKPGYDGGSDITANKATYDSASPLTTRHNRTGYTLDGYFTAQAGGTMLYNGSGTLQSSVSGYSNASGKWNRTSGAELHARWTPLTSVVTLRATEPNVTQNTATIWHVYDTAVYLDSTKTTVMSAAANPITPPVRTGYDFGGYYGTSGGTGTQYIAPTGYLTQSFTNTTFTTATASLYAKWLPHTYTVNFVANHNDADNRQLTESGSRTYDGTYTWPVPAGAFAKPGYTFLGWAPEARGGTPAADSNNGQTQGNLTAADGETLTYYAIWQITVNNITYIPNGGTLAGGGKTTYTYDDVSAVTDNIPAPPAGTSQIFRHWEVTRGAQGEAGFKLGDTYLAGEAAVLQNAYGDVELTAQWLTPEGLQADTEALTINPGIFPAKDPGGDGGTPIAYQTAAVETYVNGTLSPAGSITLHKDDGTPVYTLAGSGGTYTFTRQQSADNTAYTVYANGVTTGRTVTFGGGPAKLYYHSVTVSTLSNGTPADLGTVTITPSGGGSALTLGRASAGTYTLTQQTSSLNGDTTTLYTIAIGGKTVAGGAVSFANGNNTYTYKESAVLVHAYVDNTPADMGSISLRGSDEHTLGQTSRGVYKLSLPASGGTYTLYVGEQNTGKKVTLSADSMTNDPIELRYYTVSVTTRIDDSPAELGPVTLRAAEKSTLSLSQSATGVFGSDLLPQDTETDYSLYVNGKDTGLKATFAPTANNVFVLDFYRVTYNSNGGTGSVGDSTPYLKNTRVQVKNASPLTPPTDKIFLRWNTAPDGSGSAYYPVSGSFMITGPATLYAMYADDDTAEKSAEVRWTVAGETDKNGVAIVHYGSLEEALQAAEDNAAPVHIVVLNNCEAIDNATLGPGDTLRILQASGADSGRAPVVTIASGAALTNEGTLINEGVLNVKGTLANTGKASNAGAIQGSGTVENSATLVNTGGTLSVTNLDNTGGTLTGGTVESTATVQGGTLSGSITQHGTVKDAEIAKWAELTSAAPGRGTYVGNIANNGAILGHIKVGTSTTDTGTIQNSGTGRVGNTHPNSVVDNTFGTLCGGTIGGPIEGTDRTTVTGGTIGKSGTSTFIDENAVINGPSLIDGNVKNDGSINNPAEIGGAFENNGHMVIAHPGETHITGDVTNGNKGVITVEDGGKLVVDAGGSLNNDGKIVLEADSGKGGGQLIVEDGGKLTNDGTVENEGTLKGGGEIDNNGLIDNNPGGSGPTGTIGGPSVVNNGPGGVISGGTIADNTVIDGGTVTGDVINNGEIKDALIDKDGNITGGDYTGDVVNNGTVTNPDTIGPGGFENNGDIVIDPGHTTVTDKDGELINNGLIDNNGTLENNGDIENNGTLDNTDGTLTSDPDKGGPGGIDNNGTLTNGDKNGNGTGGLIDGQIVDNTDGIIDNGDPDGSGPGKGGGIIGGGTVIEGGIITLPVINDGLIDGGNFLPIPGDGDNPDDPKFRPDPDSKGSAKYRVYFDTNDHGTPLPHASVSAGDNVPSPGKPTEAGWIFGGWFGDYALANLWSFTTDTVNTNLTLYAKWTACDHSGSAQEPSCTQTITCSLCKATVAASGHSYADATVAPTCTAAGYTLHTCTRCGDSYTTPGDRARGHSYGPWSTSEDGSTESRTCSVCGFAQFLDSGGDSYTPTYPTAPVHPESKPAKPGDSPAPANPAQPTEPGGSGNTPEHSGASAPPSEPAHPNDSDQSGSPNSATAPEAGQGGGGAPLQGGELASVSTRETTQYSLNSGSVIITIAQPDAGEAMVAVKDTDALVRKVLPGDVLRRVQGGETVEIEVSVQPIYAEVPEADKALIETARENYAQAIDGLQIGMYLDIVLRYRVGDEAWVPIREADDDIELIIDIPAELLNDNATYFMLRTHGGIVVLLPDLDTEPNTITFKTNRFSTYALAYTLKDVTASDLKAAEIINRHHEGRCSLCGFCPQPLGICIFIWLLLAATAAAGYGFHRRSGRHKKGGEA